MSAKHRKVNAVAFAKQMAEMVIAPDSLVEVPVDVAETASVWLKIPFNLDEGDDYLKRLANKSDLHDMCMEALSHHPSLSAEDQWATWVAAGHDAKLLVNILGAQKAEAEERAKNFRYRG